VEVKKTKPRCSKMAIAGVVLGAIELLAVLRLLRMGGDATAALAAAGNVMTYRRLAVSAVIGGAAAVSPLLGWMAIRDIRQSAGQLTGLALARVAMLLSPLLLAALLGITFAVVTGSGMGSDRGGPAAVLVGLLGIFGTGFAIQRIFRKNGQFANGVEIPGLKAGVVAYGFIVTLLVIANLYWPIVEWGAWQIRNLAGS
jgi:hypothetical protein